MKKKYFVLLLIGIISVILLASILDIVFEENTTDFGLSAGMFFLSIFCLVEYKNALMPKKNTEINMTKKHYEKKGELPKYQKLCLVFLLLTIALGLIFFARGAIGIFITKILHT